MVSKNRGRIRKNQAGYSIMELSMVFAVIAIITSMALLIFTKSRTRYEFRHKAEEITRRIERARSIAIRRNQTLTLGFTSNNTVFGLTCTCPEARLELQPHAVPTGVTFSAFPTISIKGNGTLSTSASTFVMSDGTGRQVEIAINNSGRCIVGDVTEQY
ncbi:MAG TPA: GspH/FimT family pseudopilin [Blastocatellia bacterium]|jgi:type II secretory pathway pseudopilin PulG|nr:GspH/FimT family pseudopilin [Blastocatellia bacterium]